MLKTSTDNVCVYMNIDEFSDHPKSPHPTPRVDHIYELLLIL